MCSRWRSGTDGRPVAVTGSKDATVRVWDLRTGRQPAKRGNKNIGNLYGSAVGDRTAAR